MLVTDSEIDRRARDMIARHGPDAARVATERLNDMIDRNNVPARDFWACVVHRIHERQGTGPVWAERCNDWHDSSPALECAPQLGAAFH